LEFAGSATLPRANSYEIAAHCRESIHDNRIADSYRMKPKQLANVLIKILGLSICIHGIPSFVTGFVRGFLSGLSSSGTVRSTTGSGSSSTLVVGALVELVLGIILIVKSRALTDLLLKGEDE
jgi:uncharacterized membrane protein YoaK (UPF0700 family)